LAIFKRSGSVGARDFRLNLAKNFVVGSEVLPDRLSNNPILSSLVRDMFRETYIVLLALMVIFLASAPAGPGANAGARLPLQNEAAYANASNQQLVTGGEGTSAVPDQRQVAAPVRAAGN
jgi:hypothetical protein